MYLDWITGCVTLLGMYLIGKKLWYGWAVGLANQGLWLALIYARELWGLLPLTLALTWLYTKNLRAWRAA